MFRTAGVGFRVWGVGSKAARSSVLIWGFGLWRFAGFRVWGSGFRVWGFGVSVWGLGFRVQGLGFV